MMFAELSELIRVKANEKAPKHSECSADMNIRIEHTESMNRG
jgi:hypothetical protein